MSDDRRMVARDRPTPAAGNARAALAPDEFMAVVRALAKRHAAEDHAREISKRALHDNPARSYRSVD
jgi:hypothetical protein